MPSILSYEYFSPSIIEEVKNQFPNRWQWTDIILSGLIKWISIKLEYGHDEYLIDI